MSRSGRSSRLTPIWFTLAALATTVAATLAVSRGRTPPTAVSNNILVLTLVNVNAILVLLLVLLLSRNLIKFYFERGKPGAGFRKRLIASFVGFSLVPSLLLFLVASGLLTSSIENWFSIAVDRSLENALTVAKGHYIRTEGENLKWAGEIARDVAPFIVPTESSGPGGAVGTDGSGKTSDPRLLQSLLASRQELLGASSIATAVPSGGRWIEVARAPGGGGARSRTDEEALLARAAKGEALTMIRPGKEGDSIRAAAPVKGAGGQVFGIVTVETLIPAAEVARIEEITKSYEDYMQLKAFKNPIKSSYIISFLIIVLLIIFSATWFGFYIARGITVPLVKLAEGTQAVASGDLSFRIEEPASDELGVLVQSFNMMTEDLRSAQQTLQARRAYIEKVLETVGTGVVSIDTEGAITTFNRAAERILGLPANAAPGKNYKEFFTQTVSPMKTEPIALLFERLADSGQAALEGDLHLEGSKRSAVLRFHVSRLFSEGGGAPGAVLVFDDLSELIRAQKAATWQEVAQRIAHEIKNPLTPIQLSAERLRKKFFERSSDFPVVFDEGTQIIINEVNSLKMLVDEFSNFARMPPAIHRPERLEEILNDVVALYEGAHRGITFVKNFNGALPTMRLDRQQIKRLLVNLFENAVAATEGKGEIVVAAWHDAPRDRVVLEVSDDGVGIAPEDADKLFLPTFSKKTSGTGLGLAIVSRIVSEHNGQIRAAPRSPRGTTFTIELPG